MSYHDNQSSQTQQTQTGTQQTQTGTLSTDVEPIGGVSNPIVEINLYAEEQDGWRYSLSGELYVGYYHRHQDDTYMIGSGSMGVVHEINPNEIILPPIQTTEFEPPVSPGGQGEPPSPPLQMTPDEVTILGVREIVTDIFYKKFFESNTLCELPLFRIFWGFQYHLEQR